jgi:SAM-dependent methyltransferase
MVNMYRVGLLRSRVKSAIRRAIRTAGGVLGRTLPLPLRQGLVVRVGHRKLPGGFEFFMGMLDDMRRQDPDALHRFLWSNHLAYAATYEIPRRFGAPNINPTRHLLFRDILAYLRSNGVNPREDVRSVFEIGCSMGYLLRHLEAEVFPSAAILHGLDIDRHAIEAGTAHLGSLQSKVKLFAADMAAAEHVMGNRMYDLVLCCGVLMYVNQKTAERVVRSMLSHAVRLVGLICLAHPKSQNLDLAMSETRDVDGSFIHDVNRMIRQAHGKLVSSQWVGTATSGSSPSYVILAEPPAGNRPATDSIAA